MDALEIRPGLVIPAQELSWTAARASGPGGQNVNKVASKVELRFDLAGSTALDEAVKARLRAIAGGRIDAEGALRVMSQLTRDQSRNLDDARSKLAALVTRALEPPKPRVKTRPSRGARERRLGDKKRVSAIKAERKTPRGDD